MNITRRNEDLRVGDVMHLWCGDKRILRIEPYAGPLVDIIFAIAYWNDRSGGISLEKNGTTEVLE